MSTRETMELEAWRNALTGLCMQNPHSAQDAAEQVRKRIARAEHGRDKLIDLVASARGWYSAELDLCTVGMLQAKDLEDFRALSLRKGALQLAIQQIDALDLKKHTRTIR